MSYITLLSDLGLQDASVAIAKGVLMQYADVNAIVDITHEIQPFNIKQAAYLLGAAYKNFPEGTCHMPLFDIFSEQLPALVLCEYKGHYFLAPDNGLVPLALNDTQINSWLCLSLQQKQSFHDWLKEAGNIAKKLATTPPTALGLPPHKLKEISTSQQTAANVIECEIIHIDQYENVIINFTKQQFESISTAKEFQLGFIKTETISEISTNYSDVRDGYKLCRFNGNDHLEIAINHGKAASLFGMRLGGKFNDIKITCS